ncbi:hypothetical protein TREMEDRAFT_19413, partial [Tremella mesenterica DSM 1558]
SSSTSSPKPRSRRRVEIPTDRVDLVAPPDPESNLRPIIYASRPSWHQSSNSPYSADEFPSESDTKLQTKELEWRMRRERVDMMNHRFWAANNIQFQAQLARRLSFLPPPSDPSTERDIQRREDCLARFYADWQKSNHTKQMKWVLEWWTEVWAGIRAQAGIHLLRLSKR